MPGNDFDDFFEIEDKEDPGQAEPKPEQAPPAKAKAAPPPTSTEPTEILPKAKLTGEPAKKSTDDNLMADFGDFDALFDKAGDVPVEPPKAAAPPAAAPSKVNPSVEDLLSEFHLDDKPEEKSQSSAPKVAPAAKSVPEAKPTAPPRPGAPADIDDLFDEFLSADQAPAQAAAPPSRAGEAPKSAPERSEPSAPTAKILESKPEEALEDLFSEVSEANAPAPEGGEDALQSGLGIEYKQRGKGIPKIVMIAAPSVVLTIGLVILAMARFTTGGFFGWTFGQAPKDGYIPPSSSVLKKLDTQYQSTIPLFFSDRVEDYRKVQTAFEAILKADPRHSPTDARLAETLLLIGDRTIGANVRKTIGSLIDQAEKYHPSILESVRAKARYLLTDGQYAQAETLARRALSMDAKDQETLTLLGEIALSRGDLDAAVQQFNQALTINDKSPRPQHFIALAKVQQGNVDEAEKILRSLVSAEPPHPSSEIDLWRLMYSNRGKVDEAREGLKKLVETKAASLSSYDLGRAWKSLAEIAEAKSDLPGAVTAMEKAVESDRASHANAFYLGRLYLQQKQYEKAAGEFGRASSLSPSAAEYLIYEGNALREQGKLSESLGQLQKGLEKEPTNVEGLYQLGLTQRTLSRNDEAITSFENVLKADPRHLNAMINLGELYLARDNFSMAKTHLKAAIALAPQSVRAHNALGEILLTNRKFEEALGEFRLAEAKEAENVDVLSNMGRAYLATHKVEKAAAYFEKALSIDPTRLETQVALGELHHRRKDYTKALDTFRNVLKSRPKDYDTRVKLAAVLIDQQAFQEAVTELQEASKWSPNYFPTRLQLGIAWRGLGSLDASMEQLSIAQQLRPESAEAHYQMELTHIFRNDPINAEASMEKALSFDPKYTDPLMSMGNFYDGRNLYGKAVEYYLRAEKIDPKNSDMLLKIAEAYKREERPKQAKVYFQKTLSVNPNTSDAYVGLALLAEEGGNRMQAIQFLKKGQAIDPNDPRPYYYLGFMYKDSNQRQAAILALRKYLKLDPGSKEKQDIEDQIYNLERTK